VDAPDLAIAMYKRAEQYDNMVSFFVGMKIVNDSVVIWTILKCGIM